MSNYNTGNPVPSTDPRDLDDNATVFDNLANGTNASYPDRLGVARKSWHQMEQDALALISPNISALAGLTGAADRLAYFTGVGAMALTPLTAVARALLDDTTVAAQRATLGLVLTTSATDTTAGSVLKVGDFGWGATGSATPTYTVTPGSLGNTSPSTGIQAQAADVQATAQQPVSGELFGGIHIARTLRPAQFGVSGQGSTASLWYRGFSTSAALQADWLKAAKSGANSDITSLTGLTTALSVAQGGTGSTTAAAARTALGAAASGANTDITSITGSAASLTTSRSISATGDATWTVNFNGTANATAAITLANSGVGAGAYQEVTVDAKGRVTAGVAVAAYTNFTLQNSWVVASGRRAAYRKISDMISIEMQVSSGTATDGTVIATLPAGFRPPFPIAIPVSSGQNTAPSATVPGPRVSIGADGTIACFNCTSTAGGIFFSVLIPTI